MKNCKKILAFILVIALMSGLCGCYQERTLNDMLLALNQKYDKEFVLATGKAPLIEGEPELVAYCDGLTVHVYENSYDDYLAVKYEDETRKYIVDLVCEAIGENCYIDYSGYNKTSDKGDGDTTFDEFLKEIRVPLYFSAVVNRKITEYEKDEIVNQVKAAFSGLEIWGYIYFVDDSNDYSTYMGVDLYNQCVENEAYDDMLSFEYEQDTFKFYWNDEGWSEF